jgi:predicted nucleic acid-binding protein
MTLIVDASVAVKWGVLESGAAAAMALITRPERRVAPDLVIAEIANTLWKKEQRGEINAPDRGVALTACLGGYDEFAPMRSLVARALDLAIQLGHPAYDCFYLALAEAHGGTIVTADARFIERLQLSKWPGPFETL